MKKQLLLLSIIFFGFSNAFAQSWDWGRQSVGGDEGFTGAADGKGNVFVGGDFQGEMNYGTDTLKSLMVDYYLAKYDKSGNFLWAQQSHCTAGNLATASATGSATDKSGNVYVTGFVRDTVFIGANMLITPAQEGTTFLTKYGVNGNLIWTKQGYAPTFTTWGEGFSVICDKLNNVWVTGGFGDTLIFGTDTLKTPNYGAGFFLAKYDSNGSQLFATQATVPAPRVGGYTFSASRDGFDNIYLTGYFFDSIYIGNNRLISPSSGDFFICKYDSTGNVVWAKQGLKPTYTANNEDDAAAIATDKFGNSYVTGQFIDTLYFDTIKLTSSVAALFISKYDKNGNALWAKKATSLYGKNLFGSSIAMSDSGKIYLSGAAGSDSTKIQFGNFTIQQKNISDGSLVLELDSAGNVLCGSIAGTGGDDENAIVCDPSGQYVYLCGDVGGEAVFGEDTLQPQGGEPSLVARWQPCDVATGLVNTITSNLESISLFPNPNTGQFTIDVVETSCMASLQVYNIMGQQILVEPLSSAQGYNTINLSKQPNGIYLYRVISETGALLGSGKVIIQK